MKLLKIVFVLMILFCTENLFAFSILDLQSMMSNPKKYLIENPNILKSQIEMMVKRRCQKYTTNDKSECDEASRDFTQLLDVKSIDVKFDSNRSAKYVVTFVNDLDQLHSDPVALQLLKRFEIEINKQAEQIKLFKYIMPEKIKKLDLGSFAFSYYHTSYEVTRFFAVLFQDIPETEVQTRYLYEKYGPDEFTTSLHNIILKLSEMRISSKKFGLSLYGKEFLNEKIYHLFVPAYLSSLLRAKGHSNEISFLIPFLFNYIYEIGELGNPFVAYFKEPSSIVHESTQEDIISGQIGAQLGIENFVLRLSYQESKRLLEQSPKNYIQTLLLDNHL